MSFWADIEGAIAAWLLASTGLPAGHVLWANQRGVALPVRPYATLKRGSLRDLGPVGAEIVTKTVVEVATKWHTNTAYAKNDERRNGFRIYACTKAGTSAAAGGGPTGLAASGIVDGAAEWGYRRDVDVTSHMVTGRHEFTVSVQIFTSATVGDAQATVTAVAGERTAADYMHDAKISLSKPSVTDAFNSKSFAAIDAGPIRDLPDDKQGTWISRAQMDVIFSCVKTLADPSTVIDEVQGTLTAKDPDGTSSDVPFDVSLPPT